LTFEAPLIGASAVALLAGAAASAVFLLAALAILVTYPFPVMTPAR
jgi:hypothetical protein